MLYGTGVRGGSAKGRWNGKATSMVPDAAIGRVRVTWGKEEELLYWDIYLGSTPV